MEEPPNAHEIAALLIRIIPRFNRLLIHSVQASVTDDDVTLVQVITLVSLIDEPMTASELARRRSVSLQAVSSMVQPLVDRGWLTRVRKPDDRRQYLLHPTAEGVRRADEMKALIADHAAELLQHLTNEELAAASIFIPALERIIAASHEDDGDEAC